MFGHILLTGSIGSATKRQIWCSSIWLRCMPWPFGREEQGEMNHAALSTLLHIVAALQLAVAVLNLFLVPLLKWREELLRAPLLFREIFQVHAWFISITLVIFGVLTW